MGINRSVAHFDCPLMVALDRGKAERWKASSGVSTELHGGRFGARGGCEAYPWFNYWWPGFQQGGTSALTATKIALAIGFSEVILCGVPIDPGAYLDGEDDWSRRNVDQMEAYRSPWRRDSAYLKGYAFSMSGWTKKLLGGLDSV